MIDINITVNGKTLEQIKLDGRAEERIKELEKDNFEMEQQIERLTKKLNEFTKAIPKFKTIPPKTSDKGVTNATDNYVYVREVD